MSIHLVLADASPSLENDAVNAALTHINEFTTILEMLGDHSSGSSVVNPIMGVSRLCSLVYVLTNALPKVLSGTAGAVIATELRRTEDAEFPLPPSNENLARQGHLQALLMRLRAALIAAAGEMGQRPIFRKHLYDWKCLVIFHGGIMRY